MNGANDRPSGYEIAAWIITGLALLLAFPLRLFCALMSGLLVYELVCLMAPLLRATKISHKQAKLVVIGGLAAMIIAILAFSTWKTVDIARSEVLNLPSLLIKMAEILDEAKLKLPAWATAYLPDSIEGLYRAVAVWLREHATIMQEAGKGIGQALGHILIGMILGAIVSLSAETETDGSRPLAAALIGRARRISAAFRSIVFAQVRISALNTFLTCIYLLAVLPAMGVHLPLVKTMVAITFLAGLLPIIGNLISNSVIVIVSLSYSFSVALCSLAFLVLVHKLEYFLNARIVGGHIHARTWELLLAMLIMESAFGISGLIAAPIYYAYLKLELGERDLV